MSIEEEVIKIVAEQFKIEESQINRNTKFVDDLKAKSIQIIEMCATMEDQFDIEIDMEEARKNKTVGEAIDYIEKLLKEK
ncbi:acyl carrier protein [Thermococci archaeon]|nr:MAG: acyl carrier protein [Thermococci archaeon]